MNFDEYQNVSRRTLKDAPGYLHVAALGLAAEAGEACNVIKKAAEQERGLDHARLAEEVGDLLWYAAAVCSLTGLSLGACAEDNVRKLAARYPMGFTAAASIARADKGG